MFSLMFLLFICSKSVQQQQQLNSKCLDKFDIGLKRQCMRGLNPCAQSPCQNGATCSVIGEAEHVDFDCFCTSGYAGKSCEFRPCDQNPCKNGGICRTTRSAALFFCACSPSWGGKTCLIALPPIEDDDEYWEATALDANFTQQLSSGKVEWIEQLKKITPTTSNETEITTNLFEQAIGEELPIRALKNSTSKNAAISRYINKEKIEIFLVLLIVLIISLF
uniref:EGF-like domain-containing protein n=1 Tax=Meloidogyne hapla TaxID=6305 RepID=A0A1I8BAT8_MELHA